jgi:hypothetical protein
MFDCTVIPVLTTTSEQRPPVNNDRLNPISSKLILIFVEHLLNISHLGTTATFLESQECLLYTGLTVLWSAEICYLTFETYTLKLLEVQSNLSTTATLGTPKKWPLYIGGCSVESFQSKLVSKLAWPDFVQPLLTGGHYSEVAINKGLSVIKKIKIKFLP